MTANHKDYTIELYADDERVMTINSWCMDQFGIPALFKSTNVSPSFTWAVTHYIDDLTVYRFLNKADATLFKLTWL